MKFFGKELKFNNNKIYHSGDKPTPSEIGAAPTSHNHQASQVTFTDGKTFQQKLDDGSLRGPQGATGSQGPKGDTGATGPQGAAGVTPTIKAGTVTTGNAGTNAAVTASTSGTTTTFNFTIPKGATGAQGPKGDTGATGPQGPKGDTGATGPQGPAGAKGADGLTTSVTVGSTKYTHSNGNITIPAYPTALKNPSALTLQFNGTTNKTYDGSSAQTLNITPAAIGAATSSHGKHVPDTCTTITD